MSAVPTENGYHHGNLRNALLEAAEQLLVKRGAAALSLREVAKMAGVSHAAPYRHFKDKAALLWALAESGFERLRAVIRTATDSMPHDPEQQLAAAGVAYVHMAVRSPELLQLMFSTELDQPESKALRSVVMVESLLDIIRTGIETGVFRDRDPLELALVAWTSMHGLAMLLAARKIAINDAALEELVRSVAQHVIYGISR